MAQIMSFYLFVTLLCAKISSVYRALMKLGCSVLLLWLRQFLLLPIWLKKHNSIQKLSKKDSKTIHLTPNLCIKNYFIVYVVRYQKNIINILKLVLRWGAIMNLPLLLLICMPHQTLHFLTIFPFKCLLNPTPHPSMLTRLMYDGQQIFFLMFGKLDPTLSFRS